MEGMFYEAKSFKQPLNAWDISSVDNFTEMFMWAESFDENLESWREKINLDTSTDFKDIFCFQIDREATYPSWFCVCENGIYKPKHKDFLKKSHRK